MSRRPRSEYDAWQTLRDARGARAPRRRPAPKPRRWPWVIAVLVLIGFALAATLPNCDPTVTRSCVVD